jgi:hypothetical protein
MKMLSIIMLFMFIGSAYPSDSPKDAANKFYSAILAGHYQACLPEEGQLKNLSPSLSKRLTGLLQDALAYREQFTKEHPPKTNKEGVPPTFFKPPFIDGDCFSSNIEGAKRFTPGKSEKTATGYRIELRLTYFDSTRPDEKPFEWTDAVIVIKEDDRFVVDDMEFLGTWPYGNHGSLSKMLHYRQ